MRSTFGVEFLLYGTACDASFGNLNRINIKINFGTAKTAQVSVIYYSGPEIELSQPGFSNPIKEGKVWSVYNKEKEVGALISDKGAYHTFLKTVFIGSQQKTLGGTRHQYTSGRHEVRESTMLDEQGGRQAEAEHFNLFIVGESG